MSKARKIRRVHRWARYFNHYTHIPGVKVGGRSAWRAVSDWRNFRNIAFQRNHPYGHGYPVYDFGDL